MSDTRNYDTVVSSRIRLARNIADYPFYRKLDSTSCREIIDKVGEALGDGYKKTDFTEISDTEAQMAVENHSVSSEFAKSRLPHALYENGEGNIKIMVCEEDHIRLQSIEAGQALREAYSRAAAVDDELQKKLNIAFDEKLGYLTHCPTNLGTAMRASVMMFLPALSANGQLNRIVPQLSKLGLTIRGIYGEGSQSEASLYQISNQVTLGVDEDGVIKKLEEVINQISDYERKARESQYNAQKLNTEDAVSRAVGTLKYAKLISSSEFIKLYGIVRLGISLGIVSEISEVELDRLFCEVQPATVVCRMGKPADGQQRDSARAAYIAEVLK